MALVLGEKLFSPMDPDNVTVYQCGPTVYAPPHIGNLRSAVIFDVLHRVLKASYTDVTFVRNYTDVDDKIITAAKDREVAINVVTDEAIAAYNNDTSRLHVLPVTHTPRVTDSIPQIIDFIEKLIESGHAYYSLGHVLFNRFLYPQMFLNLNIDPDNLQEGSEETSFYKHHPHDFVLWKPSFDKVGWDSPWGRGRPGWHIECSVMIADLLGPTIDIHCGGADLKFPHHENECAQSHARHGQPLANYWLHNGMLNWVYDGAKLVSGVDGMRTGKMSKSLGNVLTLDDLLNEGYSAETIRYFFLTAHYTQPLIFNHSRQAINAAQSALRSLQRAMAKIGPALPEHTHVGALADDLNTPRAFARLHALANQIMADSSTDDDVADFVGMLNVLGLHENYLPKTSQQIETLIEQRRVARQSRDYATSDRLRDELVALGVEVNDKAPV